MATGSMRDLISAMIKANDKGSEIARVLRHGKTRRLSVGEKPTREKGDDSVRDYFTVADLLVQKVLVNELTAALPGATIGGEEDTATESCAESGAAIEIGSTATETESLLLEQLDGDEPLARKLAALIHTDIPLSVPDSELDAIHGVVNYSNVGIWIDPIDCTNAFIKGGNGTEKRGICIGSALPAVTVLTGAYDLTSGHSFAGVVGQPFATRSQTETKKDKHKWNGKMFWGISAMHPSDDPAARWSGVVPAAAAAAADDDDGSGGSIASGEQRPIVVHSKHEASVHLERISAVADAMPVPGSGYKGLCVLAGFADAYYLSLPTTYKWDTCGVHAIVLAMGGKVFRVDTGGPVLYNGGETANLGGFIMTLNDTCRLAAAIVGK